MKVVCPGSFDPVTHGHLDVVTRAASLFDEVVIAVGQNSAKNALFSLDERLELITQTLGNRPNVTVGVIDGLLVDFCCAHGAGAIIKGLRFAADFDYELQMAHMNHALSRVETIFLPAGQQYGTVASSILREVARNGGDVSAWVPDVVNEALRRKLGG